MLKKHELIAALNRYSDEEKLKLIFKKQIEKTEHDFTVTVSFLSNSIKRIIQQPSYELADEEEVIEFNIKEAEKALINNIKKKMYRGVDAAIDGEIARNIIEDIKLYGHLSQRAAFSHKPEEMDALFNNLVERIMLLVYK